MSSAGICHNGFTSKITRRNGKWSLVQGKRGKWTVAQGWYGHVVATHTFTTKTKLHAETMANNWLDD